jgi:hypothetical protein
VGSSASHARCSIATSGSPSHTLIQPLKSHAHERFGLSMRARSVKDGPVIEIADDVGDSNPCRAECDRIILAQFSCSAASRSVSATSRRRSITQPPDLRCG